MTEAEVRERLMGEGLEPSTWSNGPYAVYAEHRHGYDKVLVVALGSITFHLTELGRDVSMEAGDRIHLPAGTLHGADVGGVGVTCLEAQVAAGTLGEEAQHLAGWLA